LRIGRKRNSPTARYASRNDLQLEYFISSPVMRPDVGRLKEGNHAGGLAAGMTSTAHRKVAATQGISVLPGHHRKSMLPMQT
jgi:hypothetical protein